MGDMLQATEQRIQQSEDKARLLSEGEERLRKDKHEFAVEREQMRLLKDSLERM